MLFPKYVKELLNYDTFEPKSIDKLFPCMTYNLAFNGLHPRSRLYGIRWFLVFLHTITYLYTVYWYIGAAYISISSGDWTDATKVTILTVGSIMALTKMYTIIYFRKEVNDCLQKVENDIMNIHKLKEDEQKILRTGVKKSQLYNILVLTLMTPGAFVYHLIWIGHTTYSQFSDSTPKRFMILDSAVPFFEGRELETPIYEFHFGVMIVFPTLIMTTLVGFTALLINVYMHLVYQLKIVAHKMSTIYRDNPGDHKTAHRLLNEAIELHINVISFADKLRFIFTIHWNILMQMASIYLCMVGYQMTNISVFKKSPAVLAFLSAGFFKIALVCYLGQIVTNHSLAVADAAYDSGWENNPDRLVARKIKFIIMRSRKPLNFVILGYINVNMELLGNILNTAYIYVTLINSTQEDDSK